MGVLEELQDVPDKVYISEFSGVVTADMIIRKAQVIEMQNLMKVLLQKEEVQKRLSECQRMSSMDEKKYRMLLFNVLTEQLFPSMAQHFGLMDAPFYKIFVGSLTAY